VRMGCYDMLELLGMQKMLLLSLFITFCRAICKCLCDIEGNEFKFRQFDFIVVPLNDSLFTPDNVLHTETQGNLSFSALSCPQIFSEIFFKCFSNFRPFFGGKMYDKLSEAQSHTLLMYLIF
jgi:hypothetical protein